MNVAQSNIILSSQQERKF